MRMGRLKKTSCPGRDPMYQKLPNLVIGFHGCSKEVFEKVVFRGEQMKVSNNEYDWLGNGIYFWEQNYQRAEEWAKAHSKGNEPAVIGAVLDLGYCLNLTDTASTEILAQGYELLKLRCAALGTDLPKNRRPNKDGDILVRNLDCSVIELIHAHNHKKNSPEYDSVRGVFFEGGEAYPGACFRERTHVQICIRNPNCIKGVFRPLSPRDGYSMP